jgi:hypothetical protein
MKWFGQWVGDRRFPWFVLAITVLLVLPTLGTGLVGDDLLHALLLREEYHWTGGVQGGWDVFRWVGQDRRHLHELMDVGFLPWWTAPQFQCAFFRPLSSLTHAFDQHFLSGFPALMHAENVALYGLVVLVAARFYRRLLAPAWVAGLATLLYALDDAHAVVVAWIAARNALIGALCGFAALVLHDRGRRDGDRVAALAAPGLFGLGLLSGEIAAGALAYLVSYALCFDPAPQRERVRSLLPYTVVALVWIVVYKGLGYGAVGGSWYIDPGSEPIAFAMAAVQRVPMLLLAQFAGVPAMLWIMVPPDQLVVMLVAALVALGVLGVAMWRVLGQDPAARFLALGSLLSLIPVCAVVPQDRTLMFCGLGAMGLVALFLARCSSAVYGSSWATRASIYAVFGFFVLVHAIAGPALLPLRGWGLTRDMSQRIEAADRSLPEITADSVLVLVNSNNMETGLYVTASRVLRGEPRPRAIRELAHAIDGNDGEIERVDERTVVITLRRGFLDEADLTGHLVRTADIPFVQGEQIEVEGMTVRVAELTPDGRPARVLFRFDRPLEDPSLVWLTWGGTGWVSSPPPALGQKAAIVAVGL